MINENEDLLRRYHLFLNEQGFEDYDILSGNINENLVKETFESFYSLIVSNGGNKLMETTPLEYHPYIDQNPIDPSRSKLIIGTFPPFSYVGSRLKLEGNEVGDISKPRIDFFHGNELSLWQFIGIPGAKEKIINKGDVVNYLADNDSSVTDIVLFCQREKYNSDDTSLYNIGLNFSLLETLLMPNGVKTLIFTNSATNGSEGLKILKSKGKLGEVKCAKRDAFSLFLRACQLKEINIELSLLDGDWIEVKSTNIELINNAFKNLLQFKLRLNRTIEFDVFTPPSPSGSARRGLVRNAVFKKIILSKKNWSVDDYRAWVWSVLISSGNIQSIENELYE